MQPLTKEQYEQEMKTFEGFCNKIMISIDESINSTTDVSLKEKLAKRKDGFEKFINFVTLETEFLIAPASTRYHLCIKYGLLLHSNLVTKTALKLNKVLGINAPEYKVIFDALFHDLGKAGVPGGPLYIPNEPTEKQKQYGYGASVPYSYNNDILYNEHEDRSLYFIMKYIDIDEDEYLAIRHHNEPWNGITQCLFKKCEIMTLIQYSDYWSTLYLEERND